MLGGILAYGALLIPTFVRAHIFCGPNLTYVSYMCSGVGLPALWSLLPWLMGLPFFLLFMSSRLRRATEFGNPLRKPIAAGNILALLVALLSLLLAFVSRPDWSSERATADLATLLTALLFALYAFLLSLAHDEPASEQSAPATITHRRGLLGRVGLWAQGLVLYAGAAVMVMVEMSLQTALCRKADPQAVCDGPAYGAMAGLLLWACVLPFFILLLWGAIGRNGARPWARIEPRMAVLLVAAFLLVKAVGAVPGGLMFIGPALFWLLFAAWLVLLSELCRRAAKDRLP
jgi:hypothetical protein